MFLSRLLVAAFILLAAVNSGPYSRIPSDDDDFNSETSANPMFKDICGICLENLSEEDFKAAVCSHVFHEDCVTNLIMEFCPICRNSDNPWRNHHLKTHSEAL